MGLSTAPQLRFLKRQGKGGKAAAMDTQLETPAQPAAGVLDFQWVPATSCAGVVGVQGAVKHSRTACSSSTEL